MNDKQKQRWEEVRERVACEACGSKSACEGYPTVDRSYPFCLTQLENAEEILNLKDSSGNYLIEIPDVEQNIPKLVSLTGEASIEEKSAFCLGVENLKEEILKGKWKKFIPREG